MSCRFNELNGFWTGDVFMLKFCFIPTNGFNHSTNCPRASVLHNGRADAEEAQSFQPPVDPNHGNLRPVSLDRLARLGKNSPFFARDPKVLVDRPLCMG
jgi:hypothetical protein